MFNIRKKSIFNDKGRGTLVRSSFYLFLFFCIHLLSFLAHLAIGHVSFCHQSEHIMDSGSHVGFQISTKNTNLVEDHSVNISGKFG
jgi:hypothetical protein